MRESVTYQAILDEGRAEGRADGRAEGRAAEARALLALLGEQKFGPPDARARAALEAIGDAERLEALARRLLAATSWDDLLGQP
jgi:predicted transposase YdaD